MSPFIRPGGDFIESFKLIRYYNEEDVSFTSTSSLDELSKGQVRMQDLGAIIAQDVIGNP